MIDYDKFAKKADELTNEYQEKAKLCKDKSPYDYVFMSSIAIAINKVSKAIIDSSTIEKWD